MEEKEKFDAADQSEKFKKIGKYIGYAIVVSIGICIIYFIIGGLKYIVANGLAPYIFGAILLFYYVRWRKTCPKCRSKWAFSSSSHKEPRQNFDKRTTFVGGRSHVKHMEVGVKVTHQVCRSCGYERQKSKRYQKELGNHYE